MQPVGREEFARLYQDTREAKEGMTNAQVSWPPLDPTAKRSDLLQSKRAARCVTAYMWGG